MRCLISPCFAVQAYTFNDHGISEQWMQTYVGKTSTSADAGDSSTSNGNSNVSDNGSGPALSDEASHTQVRRNVIMKDEDQG